MAGVFFYPRVSASTVAPVDVAQPSRQLTPCTRMPAHWHTWTRPQGAQPLTYGSCHTWRSAFHHVCSSLKETASGASVSALIRVNPRFFKNVIFQRGLTGSTGYVFNHVHPVILSNLKCQLSAPWQSAKLLRGE